MLLLASWVGFHEPSLPPAHANTHAESLLEGSTNCYTVPNHGQKFCNIGDHIRLNFPDRNGKPNWIRVKFWSTVKTNGQFKCCATRSRMDNVLEGRKHEFLSALNEVEGRWHEDVKCTIGGMMSCEECGPKCNSCGVQC